MTFHNTVNFSYWYFMFLIKTLDDLLKVSGATLEGTVPRVAQLEADEQDVSTTWLDVAGDGGGEWGGDCRALWWERLFAKLVSAEDSLGRLHEGSAVCNTTSLLIYMYLHPELWQCNHVLLHAFYCINTCNILCIFIACILKFLTECNRCLAPSACSVGVDIHRVTTDRGQARESWTCGLRSWYVSVSHAQEIHWDNHYTCSVYGILYTVLWLYH